MVASRRSKAIERREKASPIGVLSLRNHPHKRLCAGVQRAKERLFDWSEHCGSWESVSRALTCSISWSCCIKWFGANCIVWCCRSVENQVTMHKCFLLLVFMVIILPSLGLTRCNLYIYVFLMIPPCFCCLNVFVFYLQSGSVLQLALWCQLSGREGDQISVRFLFF